MLQHYLLFQVLVRKIADTRAINNGLFVLLLTCLSIAGYAQANVPTFIEQNGMVIVEMESGAINARWTRGTEGAITFYQAAQNQFNSPLNSGIIRYNIRVTRTGIYRFEWHNRINFGNENTEHNDAWLRFPNNSDVVFFGHRGVNLSAAQLATNLANGTNIVYPRGSGLEGPNTTPNGASANGFFKVYMNTLGRWVWTTRTSDFNHHEVFVFFRNPGVYTMEIGARSQGHAIDKIAMYNVNTYGVNISNKSTLLNAPESPREGTGGNQLPIVSAGGNQTITLPTSSVVLSGSASDPDGSIASVAWTQRSGPAPAVIATPNALVTSVSGLQAGTYVFRLTATDNQGASAFAETTVTVNAAPANQPPVANAGGNQSITLPTNSIVLNGSASSDPDGTIASFSWTQQSGPSSAVLTTPNSAVTTATGLVQGTYVFRLTVTDNQGASAFADASVAVNVPGQFAGFWLEAECATVGSGIETLSSNLASNGSYIRMVGSNNTNSAPTNAAQHVRFTVNVISSGQYYLYARVGFPSGSSDSFWIRANGGSWTSWNDAGLTGEGFDWRQVHVGNDRSALLVLNLQAGANTIDIARREVGAMLDKVYVGQELTLPSGLGNLAVNCGNISPPANQLPVANAGGNQTITLPTSSVVLNGSASSDPDGTIASFSWTQQSGPSSAVLTTPDAAITTASGLQEGTYVFRLTVTDNQGASAFAETTVTVNAAPPNQPPVANAGGNQTITLPTSSVTLNGSASSDPDGTVASFSWTQQSGPSSAVLTTPDAAIATASGLQEGTYVFRLTVTDNQGVSAFAETTVTVNPVPSGPAVVSFTLMDSDTNLPVPGYENIQNGAQLPLNSLPQGLNIRANTNPEIVGSVVFNLVGSNGGTNRTQTETAAPYALFGDIDSDYSPWLPGRPQSGFAYQLTATPFSDARGRGTAGTALTINFSFVEESGNSAMRESDWEEVVEARSSESLELAVYPNPVRDKLTFEIAGVQGGFSAPVVVTLQNMLGQTLYNQVLPQATNRHEVLVHHLPKGVYMAILRVGNERKVQRIIIE